MAVPGPESGAPAPLRVFVSAGSNIEPVRHMRLALEQLRRRFGPLRVSSVYRSRPAGFEGEDFLNLVVEFSSSRSPGQIVAELEHIHDMAGRDRGAGRFSPRTLDLDLLLYGSRVLEEPPVPRQDILEYSFVLGPLAELAPALCHPVTGRTMADLWSAFDKARHPLQKLPVSVLQGAG